MGQPLAWGIYCPTQAVMDDLWSTGKRLEPQIRRVRLAMVRQANDRGYTLAELFVGYDEISRLVALQELEAHLNAFADVTEAIFFFGALSASYLDVLATEKVKLQGGVGDYARFRLYRLEGERRLQAEPVGVGEPNT
jgi:hypothetical protein